MNVLQKGSRVGSEMGPGMKPENTGEPFKEQVQNWTPKEWMERSVLEIRGDGKAGGGLVLAMQSLAGLLIQDPQLHVQEWPFFSSARKGAAIRSFLRVSRKPILQVCEVTNPQISILMDEGAAHFVDFAEGVPESGVFVLNTKRSPEEVARHYHLKGKVLTINGDGLGEKFLRLPMGNISIFATLVQLVGLSQERALESLKSILKKRRLPDAIIKANLELFQASQHEIQMGEFTFSKGQEHRVAGFQNYGDLPLGAQTGLRISRSNLTANYARSGSRVSFEDPDLQCTGCSACIVSCPENIILHQPDEKRGLLVTGAEFNSYCKSCRECIESCPQTLFVERPYEEKWEDS